MRMGNGYVRNPVAHVVALCTYAYRFSYPLQL